MPPSAKQLDLFVEILKMHWQLKPHCGRQEGGKRAIGFEIEKISV